MPTNRKSQVSAGIFEETRSDPEFERFLADYLELDLGIPSVAENVARHSHAIRSAYFDDAWLKKTAGQQLAVDKMFTALKKFASIYNDMPASIKKAIELGQIPKDDGGTLQAHGIYIAVCALLKDEAKVTSYIDTEVQTFDGRTDAKAISVCARCCDAFRELKLRKPSIHFTPGTELYDFYNEVRRVLPDGVKNLNGPKQAIGNYLQYGN